MDKNEHGFGYALAEIALDAINGLAGKGGWETILGATMPSDAFSRLLAKHNGHFKRFETLFGEWLKPAELRDEYREIARAYTEDGRFYHVMLHLHDCFMACDKASRKIGARQDIQMAIFFHDKELDLARNDNEKRSGEYFARFAQRHGIPAEVCEQVEGLILATDRSVAPKTESQRQMRDIDIINLGGRWRRFAANNRKLKMEFEAAFGPQQGTENRFLQELSKKGRIFESDHFEHRFGKKARRNITRLLGKEASHQASPARL